MKKDLCLPINKISSAFLKLQNQKTQQLKHDTLIKWKLIIPLWIKARIGMRISLKGLLIIR